MVSRYASNSVFPLPFRATEPGPFHRAFSGLSRNRPSVLENSAWGSRLALPLLLHGSFHPAFRILLRAEDCEGLPQHFMISLVGPNGLAMVNLAYLFWLLIFQCLHTSPSFMLDRPMDSMVPPFHWQVLEFLTNQLSRRKTASLPDRKPLLPPSMSFPPPVVEF
jgi:hypothetical protein